MLKLQMHKFRAIIYGFEMLYHEAFHVDHAVEHFNRQGLLVQRRDVQVLTPRGWVWHIG